MHKQPLEGSDNQTALDLLQSTVQTVSRDRVRSHSDVPVLQSCTLCLSWLFFFISDTPIICALPYIINVMLQALNMENCKMEVFMR